MLIILFAAVIALVGVTFWKPHWIIGLFIATTMIKGVLQGTFPFLVSYTYNFVVAGLAFVAILVNYARTRDIPRIRWSKPLFICYLVLVILTVALYPMTRAPQAGLKKLLMFTCYVWIPLIIPPLFLRTEDNIRQLVRMMLTLGVIASIGTIFFSSKMYGAEDYTRDTFLHGNPLAPSDAAAIACVVVLSFWLIGKRILWTIFIPLFALGILVTGSRGAIIGIAACFLLFLYAARNKAFLRALIFAPIVCTVLYIAIGAMQDRIGSRFSMESAGSGFQDRIDIIHVTVGGWMRYRPITGGGVGEIGRAHV